MNGTSHLHPVFADILNSFADGGRSFSRYEREMYPAQCESVERERCYSCDKLHESDELDRTVDGPTCADCMEVTRMEAEAELREMAADSLDLARAIIAHAEGK